MNPFAKRPLCDANVRNHNQPSCLSPLHLMLLRCSWGRSSRRCKLLLMPPLCAAAAVPVVAACYCFPFFSGIVGVLERVGGVGTVARASGLGGTPVCRALRLPAPHSSSQFKAIKFHWLTLRSAHLHYLSPSYARMSLQVLHAGGVDAVDEPS